MRIMQKITVIYQSILDDSLKSLAINRYENESVAEACWRWAIFEKEIRYVFAGHPVQLSL